MGDGTMGFWDRKLNPNMKRWDCCTGEVERVMYRSMT